LRWYLPSRHPDVERRFHEEIDSVLDGRLPTAEDMPQLPYTLMVSREALRLYGPARESEEAANQLRGSTAGAGGADVVSVERFEVVVDETG
jgi:hypothetical protein